MKNISDIFKPSETLDMVLEDVKRLKAAYFLLVEVYFDSETILPDKLRFKIQDFFGCDD